MMCQAKRQSAAMMALVFFVLSVFPVKRSEAFAVLPLVAAPQFINGVGALITGMAGLAAVMGMPIMMVALSDDQGNAVRIPLSDKPESQPPLPEAAPSVAVSESRKFYGPGGYVYDSAGAACSAGYAGQADTSCECGEFHCTVLYQGNYATSISPLFQTTATCPPGYTSSGSNCLLQNARQAEDDKKCDLLYAQGAFATADDLNCGATVDGTKLAPMIRDGKVIAYGVNSSGQPLMWEVTPGAQTVTIKESVQIQTATQTQVKTTTATIDAATSAVTSVATQTAPGSIASPSGASAPTSLAPGETASPVNTPTVTQDATRPLDIQWPSDYARTGEAKTAADSITELMKPTSEVNDPTVPDWADHWGDTFNPLKAWSMPGHSSQCPVAGFSWNGVAYSIDSHCQLITDHWSGLQTAAIVVWSITALFIMLGA